MTSCEWHRNIDLMTGIKIDKVAKEINIQIESMIGRKTVVVARFLLIAKKKN